MTILHRQIVEPIFDRWERGAHWFVECYDGEHPLNPRGIAFVSAFAKLAHIDCIAVLDVEREPQIRRELILACRRAWPGIEFNPSQLSQAQLHVRAAVTRGIDRNP